MGIGFKSVTWLLAMFTALCGGMAARAAPARGQAGAEAVILRPFTIVKTEDLLFGNMATSNIQGTVVINPNTGAVTHTNVTGLGGTIQAAQAVGYGTPGSLVWVRWSTQAFTLARVGGGASMTVSQLRTNCVLFCFAGSDPRIVPANGFLDVRFGGQLNVGANQPDGEYVGSFAVTIDYP